MEKFKKPVAAVVIYFILNIIIAAIGAWGWAVLDVDRSVGLVVSKNDGSFEKFMMINPSLVAICDILTCFFTIGICYYVGVIKRVDWKLQLSRLSKPFFLYYLFVSLFGLVAAELLNILLDLPNILQAQFLASSRNVFGILSLSFFVPICEEFVFREGVIGNLLRFKVSPVKAVLVSSFFSAVITMNPSEMLYTFIVGIILGLIYAKTDNLLFVMFIHIFNNAINVAIMNIYGDADQIMIIDRYGILPIFIIAIILSGLCASGLYTFVKSDKTE